MKVTIDTKEDNYEDIKKILNLLTNIIEKKEEPVNTSADTTVLMNMFGDDQTGNAANPAADSVSAAGRANLAEKAPDFSSFLNLTKRKEEQKKELPRIEYF